jgi:hypothetical protein
MSYSVRDVGICFASQMRGRVQMAVSRVYKCPKSIAVLALLVLAITSVSGWPQSANAPSADPNETTASKIARALSAGPPNVTKDATVAEMDERGNMKILRQGTNDFTCLPGNPRVTGQPALCEDKVAMQWNRDFTEHKPKPTNTVPGIEYMLAGATQRSDSDPFDKTDPPMVVGPHWMILWPFDPKTSGLPTHHKATGAYIMWAGSPYAHVHVMGAP